MPAGEGPVDAQWIKPPELVGSDGLIRIGASYARGSVGCPAGDSVKIRPKLRLRHWAESSRTPLTTFTLDPVMKALDRIEFDGVSDAVALAEIASDRVHPGLVTFARHATSSYRASCDARQRGLVPSRDLWVVQRQAKAVWELYAWGRRYWSVDGDCREFRFLRTGTSAAARAESQVAIAAFATAFGDPAPWPRPWSSSFETTSAPAPTKVRVTEIDLATGRLDVLFDGTPAEASELFELRGRSEVTRLSRGVETHAGSWCSGCKRQSFCDALPAVPALLGMTAHGNPERSVSASNLRYHRACPAQSHLRDLGLPKTWEYDPSSTLGQAVHAWLDERHRRGLPCDAADTPPEADWSAGGWSVEGDQAASGRRMIEHHRALCAFQSSEVAEQARVEPTLVVHDPQARAVVVAKPDLLYRDGEAWVWREVKTTTRPQQFATDPIEMPQLAMAVVILSSGALGGEFEGARVELEILHPDGSDIQLIDAADPDQITRARDALRSYVEPWYHDEVFPARPGRNCRWCPVSRWCPSFPGDSALQIDRTAHDDDTGTAS